MEPGGKGSLGILGRWRHRRKKRKRRREETRIISTRIIGVRNIGKLYKYRKGTAAEEEKGGGRGGGEEEEERSCMVGCDSDDGGLILERERERWQRVT
ncbi:hypothetical protein TIFTF001_000421 [Ficus carica]|uniref:Uncharacterized protein n=1 Tax=Ficus carica TaxID=3494 RepID=A0AA87YVQ0_FICCA|nr:hypothetical protein TIFTF001_000421 [Ficus carica]